MRRAAGTVPPHVERHRRDQQKQEYDAREVERKVHLGMQQDGDDAAAEDRDGGTLVGIAAAEMRPDLPDEGRRSWTVSCLKLPEAVTSKAVTQPLAQQGWTIGTGYGKLKDTTIRIGHMGEHTVGALNELLGLIEKVLD